MVKAVLNYKVRIERMENKRKWSRMTGVMGQSGDLGSDSGGRMKGVSVMKPVVYGNIARYFGKKREEDGHTHEWTVYLKPYLNEDMSTYVKKVQFKLHESYANQTRVITRPPYEVTETGWGEFEINIKIYFQDPNERPVTIYHILKLFQSSPGTCSTTTTVLPATASLSSTPPLVLPTPPAADAAGVPPGKKILVAEAYEELVFQEPSALMHQLLLNCPKLTLGEYCHYTDFETKKKKTLENIALGKEKVNQEIMDLRAKIQIAKDTLVEFKEKFSEAQAEITSDS
ncbi:YEATS protein [Trinorchestia longiramus]|nr:YEATS protein [Trinorchestia longiramus]